MTFHSKFDEVYTLVNAGVAVLLTGERGSGKTTLAKHVTNKLKLPFYSLSMTRQTTLSHLMGFINVNGTYVPSHLRKAAESGGVFLLDELDASDPNVILSLNTIENGYLTFPDEMIELHKDFKLVATSNPQDNHKDYNGRSKLDASTLDRFDVINVERDDNLERLLIDFTTYSHISLIRKCLEEQNSSNYISMRDSLRFQKRKDLKLLDDYIIRLFKNNQIAYENYLKKVENIPEFSDISKCETLSDVWKFAKSNKL